MAKKKKPQKRKWISFKSTQNKAIRTNYVKAKIDNMYFNFNEYGTPVE